MADQLIARLDDGSILDVANMSIIGLDGVVELRAIFIVDPSNQHVISSEPAVNAGETIYEGEIILIASVSGKAMTIKVTAEAHGFTWNGWRERAIFIVASGYLDRPNEGGVFN